VSQDGLLLDLVNGSKKGSGRWRPLSLVPANNTSPTCEEENPPANFYLESSPGSDCQVSFEGVLHIEGHLAGKHPLLNGTLVMPEQVKIDADIEVGVADQWTG